MLLVPSSESSLYGEMMSMARMDGWEALYNIMQVLVYHIMNVMLLLC